MYKCDECGRRFWLTHLFVVLAGKGRICSWKCLTVKTDRMLDELWQGEESP